MRRRSWDAWHLLVLLTALGAACAYPASQIPQGASADAVASARSGPKSITIVLPIDPTALAQ